VLRCIVCADEILCLSHQQRQLAPTQHAGGAVSPRSLMTASRFPLAAVASLEACTYAAALGVLLPALPQHRLACVALAALGAVMLPLHAWCAQ
jgi:hypothetical protein